ncbi:MAG: toll/interleukin-1 receptor domain-containing protein [Chitinophagaceae bacterium]|nr:toll/interleukin-1 receptor domain-containing protein [Chitinophagaceae bacterium]
MKVFISWSGPLSQRIGETFKDWLPAVLQAVKPYFTPSDIEKGSRWSSNIAKELEECKIGIFIFTKENLDSQWMMFEAGALSKTLDTSKVCPILFGLDNSDFKGPLTQFQTSQFNKLDVKKLLRTINNSLSDQKLEDKILDEVFELWWQKLDQKILKILEENKVENTSLRDDRELLEEVLAIVRFTAKHTSTEKKLSTPKINYDIDIFEGLVNSFVLSTQNIFDLDWEHTKSCLDSGSIQSYIDPRGNFLEPNVEDEGSNWGNRVGFLESFRKLERFMQDYDIVKRDDSDLPF